MENNFDKIKVIIQNPKLFKLFWESMVIHKEVEKRLKKELSEFKLGDKIKIKNDNLDNKKYFEKNFFSLFFLTLFKYLSIERNKIVDYGTILYLLRAIITATDNIIDREDKGTIELNIKSDRELKNILIILFSQEILQSTFDNLTDGKNRKELSKKILDVMYDIANGEAAAKLNYYENYPSFEFIEREIHKKIGGELLGLSIDSAITIEEDKREDLIIFRKAVVEVGMALQGLDDMTDVLEDIDDNRTNLFIAFLLESKDFTYESLKNIKIDEKFIINNKDKYKKFMERCINLALSGFDQLNERGYPINRKQALKIMGFMFKMRGLEKEWKIYTREV